MSEDTTPHPIPAAVAEALAKRGYESLTPVQVAVSDPALAGRDLLVSAQTGSGKTVAFGLALAPDLLAGSPRLGPPDLPGALIIAPTRELAMQVKGELEWLYAEAGASIASCVGGMDYRNERRALERGAHIVVGTPGRLRDHLDRGSLDISALKAVVLDEADEMLDLGFREELEAILSQAPEDRRTLMFSATVSKPIAELAREFQRDAERISTVAERESHADIEYKAVVVEGSDRENAIVNLLRFHEAQTAIVFCSTRLGVSHLTSRFLNRGFSVVALSGELSQEERSRALQSLRDGRARVCIATDVAARGIDLPGLDLVVHADLPTNKETLLHRSGRTGRAGRKGVSALIVPNSARKKAERLLGFAKVQAEWGPAPSAEAVRLRDGERLLGDAVLNTAIGDEEAAEVEVLVSAFTPEALAAAVRRLWLAGRSAPEELRETGGRRDHAAFDNSQWVALSVGHADRAEARWLLPMICRAGGITRADIGAIRVGERETYVQIAASAAPGFMSSLGKAMELEGGIRVRVAASDEPGTAGAPRSTGRPERRPRPERMPRSERAVRPAAEETGEWQERKPRHKDRATGPAGPDAEDGFIGNRPKRSYATERAEGSEGKPAYKPAYKGKSEGKAEYRAKPDYKPRAEGARSEGRGEGRPDAKSFGKPRDAKFAPKTGSRPGGKFGDNKFGDRPKSAPKSAKYAGKPAGKPPRREG